MSELFRDQAFGARKVQGRKDNMGHVVSIKGQYVQPIINQTRQMVRDLIVATPGIALCTCLVLSLESGHIPLPLVAEWLRFLGVADCEILCSQCHLLMEPGALVDRCYLSKKSLSHNLRDG